ncbi:MAG: DUF3604 domain-containing protein [Waddliaceae bacterium]
MARSICYCEPKAAFAGESNTWHFIYKTSVKLQKGTILRFDLFSDGREIDWEIPSVKPKATKNVIYGLLGSKKIYPTESEIAESFTPVYDFVLPTVVKPDETFTIVIGSPNAKQLVSQGTTAQTYTQRRRVFHLYVDTSGKGKFGDPEVFTMDIRGGPLHNIKLFAPSIVFKNKRFDLMVRFEDEFGNLTGKADEDTLIELSYAQLRENLNWQIFVPDTGFLTIPNLYFNDEDTYVICLRNTKTKEEFHSKPIKCFATPNHSLFWGQLHGESEKVDSTENIENCLRHLRDDDFFQFFAASPFANQEETSNDIWKLIQQNISEFDEGERFVTFQGFQWVGKPKEEGVRQFLHAKDSRQLIRYDEGKGQSLKKIYKGFAPKECISIPTFTMAKGFEYDFKDFNPEFERVVEIYNAWGSSETTAKSGNSFPIHNKKKTGVNEVAEGSIIKALNQNKRFGFVAGGLDDRGIYSSFYEDEQEQYFPGYTGIFSEHLTRSSLFDALYNRRCYATTGERMILVFSIAGAPMGSELTTAEKPGLIVNRHIKAYAAGTCKLKTIELVRGGDVIHTVKPDLYHHEFSYDDLVDINTIALSPQSKESPFLYYYLRVTQEDGNMAWSSPIWIDVEETSLKSKPRKK